MKTKISFLHCVLVICLIMSSLSFALMIFLFSSLHSSSFTFSCFSSSSPAPSHRANCATSPPMLSSTTSSSSLCKSPCVDKSCGLSPGSPAPFRPPTRPSCCDPCADWPICGYHSTSQPALHHPLQPLQNGFGEIRAALAPGNWCLWRFSYSSQICEKKKQQKKQKQNHPGNDGRSSQQQTAFAVSSVIYCIFRVGP